jgi:hypothetical protein
MPRREVFDREAFDRRYAELLRQTEGKAVRNLLENDSELSPVQIQRFEVIFSVLDDFSRRLKALRKLDPEAAEVIENLSFEDAWKLRNLLPRARGRKPGKGSVMNDDDLLTKVRKAVAEGEPPTSAVRRLLSERGVQGKLKGKIDHITWLLKRLPEK